MKFLFSILFLAVITTAHSQQLSSYKYIIIPDKFSGFDENQYELNGYLFSLLKSKNYEALPQDKNQWPQAVKNDNCLALTADIEKGKSMFKNKLELVFKDCSGKQISKIEGVSSIKEYNEGYHDALHQAADKIEGCNAKEIDQIKDTVTEVPASSDTIENTTGKSVSGTFKNGETALTKSDLTDGSFLLIREDNSQVYAQFFPSTKTGVYHVKMINPQGGNYYTIGYFSGNTISIEALNSTDKWTLVEFRQ